MRLFSFALNTIYRLLVFIPLGAGGHLGIGPGARAVLAGRILRNYLVLKKGSASTPAEQLALVNAVLHLPKEVPGDLAEFGCFKGVASCALSLAARLTGRRLIIFDSFEGLPPPAEDVHNITGGKVHYAQGEFAGSLEEVRGHITRYGAPEVVEYVKGYFNTTLPGRTADRFAFIFEDADLVESVRDILVHAWSRLSSGGIFFCHEARDLEVVQLFYDRDLWQRIGRRAPPGLVGGGVGLPLDPRNWREPALAGSVSFRGSCLAYVVNRAPAP